MAAAPEVRIESRDDVLRLVLNRPKKGNALTPEMMGALTAAFAGAGEHGGLRAVILAAEGKQFCTGADLGWMASPPTVEQGEALAELFRTIAECPLPTLALVQGGCYGGAMGLVAACDFVLAAPGAEFGFTPREGILLALGYNKARGRVAGQSGLYDEGFYFRFNLLLDNSLWTQFDQFLGS